MTKNGPKQPTEPKPKKNKQTNQPNTNHKPPNNQTNEPINEDNQTKHDEPNNHETYHHHETYHQNSNNDKNTFETETTDEVTTIKKRGRKPKGGKIIQPPIHVPIQEYKTNIILHLKCSLKDLLEDWSENNIDHFCLSSELTYDIINPDVTNSIHIDNEIDNSETNETWKKLKILQHNLHTNNVNDKKSACFWCTYDFGNPPVHIPKHEMKGTYHVYGCFCSPECAVAHLMAENIDSSTKFERYYLTNHIYSKIYNYKKNIKPAPNPHYILDKFYGNLSIQEYRSLFKNECLYLILDKPLARALPELHEDNDDFIISNKLISSNAYNTKKKKSKNNILNDNFGIFNNNK